MEKAFKTMGYKTQIKTLADYHNDYGLKGDDDGASDGEDDEEEEEEGDDEDDMSSEEDAIMDGVDGSDDDFE